MIKQLQQQDGHITKITEKCKSKKNDKTSNYLDEHGITYRKIMDRPNIFHAIMVPNTLQAYIYYMKATMHQTTMAPTDYIISLGSIIFEKNESTLYKVCMLVSRIPASNFKRSPVC